MTLIGKRISAAGVMKSALLGAVLAMAISAVASMILASMMNAEKITEVGMGYGVMVMHLIAAYMGAYAACKKNREQ